MFVILFYPLLFLAYSNLLDILGVGFLSQGLSAITLYHDYEVTTDYSISLKQYDESTKTRT